MGLYNEQGGEVGEPETNHMHIKEEGRGGASAHAPSSSRGQLCKLPPKDAPRHDAMFIVGGWTREAPDCRVERFHSEYNEWKWACSMAVQRGAVAACALDGRIYAAGGEDHQRCFSSVERYDPESDSWGTDVAALSSPRSGVCLAAMDGFLYAVGGYDGITSTNTVERYDPSVNRWTTQAPMSTRRTRAAAAVLDGHLYVIGGNDGDTVLNSVERYSPLEGSWAPCASMRCPRESAGCTVHLGKVYVAGGRDELNLKLNTAECFDPEACRWSPVKHMRNKRHDVSLVVFNGAMLAVGGCDGITDLKTVEVYCHLTNTWRHFGSMKTKHPGGRVAILH